MIKNEIFIWKTIKDFDELYLFFWWWREKNETPEVTAIREIKEEIELTLNANDLVFLEIDWPKVFSTWIYIAYIYVLLISDNDANKILWLNNVMKFDLDTLVWQDVMSFAIERWEFLEKINRALYLSKNLLWN